MTWNVHSINKIKELREIFLLHDADIMAIQETWLSSDNIDVSVQGYHTPWVRNRTKHTHGGVATYVRSQYATKKLPSPFVEKVLETLLLEIDTGKEKIKVLNVYLGTSKKEEGIMCLLPRETAKITLQKPLPGGRPKLRPSQNRTNPNIDTPVRDAKLLQTLPHHHEPHKNNNL